MSMSLDLLKSTVTNDGFDLDIGDVKLQCNTVLNELNMVSVSFESYMDACNRFLILCDTIEANEGMLDPTIRDFVNRNGELSMALGIDLAMEDDSQETQKENGEKVTEKKQGFFRRMWEGIKRFVQAILNAIGSFFHWLGNLFANTEKKIEWIKSDGKQIAERILNLPPEKIKNILFADEDKDGNVPFTIVTKKSNSATEDYKGHTISGPLDSDNSGPQAVNGHKSIKISKFTEALEIIDPINRAYAEFGLVAKHCEALSVAHDSDTMEKERQSVINTLKYIYELISKVPAERNVLEQIKFDDKTGKISALCVNRISFKWKGDFTERLKDVANGSYISAIENMDYKHIDIQKGRFYKVIDPLNKLADTIRAADGQFNVPDAIIRLNVAVIKAGADAAILLTKAYGKMTKGICDDLNEICTLLKNAKV